MTTLGLVFRTHRFETRVLGLFSVVALAAAVAIILRLRAFGIPIECFNGTADGSCDVYAGPVQDYFRLDSWATVAFAGLVVMTVVPSVLLGLALSAKELDRGTTAFVWSLTTSRRRWFVQRVAPAAIAVAAVGLLGGLVANQLEIVRAPTVDAMRSFEAFGFRGLALAGLGLTVFGATLAVGSVVARLLPALIAAVVVGVVSVIGVNVVSDHLLEPEVILVRQADVYGQGPQHLVLPMAEPRTVDERLVTPSGEVLTFNQAMERYGGIWEVDDASALPPDLELPPGAVPMEGLLLVNPGELYPLADARMGLLFAVVGLGWIVLAFAVMDRRRP